MILIADSGSTKTQWALIDCNGEAGVVATPGINPVMLDRAGLLSALTEARRAMASAVVPDAIHFYGAGCLPEICPEVRDALSEVFGADTVRVHSDMLGAARALWADSPGIAAILGTGANSCYYDGQRIVANTPPLGYILGDEGSGARLGARLINGVLKGYLPSEICRDFAETTGLDKATIIERVYRRPGANAFLASQTGFIARHISNGAVTDMVIDEFRLFFSRNIVHAYPSDMPIGFVGSIAAVFEQQLREAAASMGLETGRILRHPLPALIDYHAKTTTV